MLGSFYFIKHLLTYRDSQSCQDLVLNVFTSIPSYDIIFEKCAVRAVSCRTAKSKFFVKLPTLVQALVECSEWLLCSMFCGAVKELLELFLHNFSFHQSFCVQASLCISCTLPVQLALPMPSLHLCGTHILHAVVSHHHSSEHSPSFGSHQVCQKVHLHQHQNGDMLNRTQHQATENILAMNTGLTRMISMLSFNHIFLSVDTTTIKKKVYVKLQYGKVSISHLCSGSVQI